MSEPRKPAGALAGVGRAYFAVVRGLANALAGVAGLAVLFMMAVTCTDVVLRIFRRSLTGATDLVTMAGAAAVAFALPYTTAVKGHVAIEYFFHKLNRTGRTVVDTLMRLVAMGMFSVAAWESARMAVKMRANNVLSMTLEVPLFWVPGVIAAGCAVTVLVVLGNLLHPGRELIKP
jgi:TRAP-type C4-dicarboxylate transport system permease small subunit